MNSRYKVNLMPIEPILFSDNRSARAGGDHLIRDQNPSPHAIYGAIGAYIASNLAVKKGIVFVKWTVVVVSVFMAGHFLGIYDIKEMFGVMLGK